MSITRKFPTHRQIHQWIDKELLEFCAQGAADPYSIHMQYGKPRESYLSTGDPRKLYSICEQGATTLGDFLVKKSQETNHALDIARAGALIDTRSGFLNAGHFYLLVKTSTPQGEPQTSILDPTIGQFITNFTQLNGHDYFLGTRDELKSMVRRCQANTAQVINQWLGPGKRLNLAEHSNLRINNRSFRVPMDDVILQSDLPCIVHTGYPHLAFERIWGEKSAVGYTWGNKDSILACEQPSAPPKIDIAQILQEISEVHSESFKYRDMVASANYQGNTITPKK